MNEVKNVTILPGTVSPIQEVSAIERGQLPVMEPALILGAAPRDMESESDMAAKSPTSGDVHSVENPTIVATGILHKLKAIQLSKVGLSTIKHQHSKNMTPWAEATSNKTCEQIQIVCKGLFPKGVKEYRTDTVL